jgi:PAS domain S-box-containing protein
VFWTGNDGSAWLYFSGIAHVRFSRQPIAFWQEGAQRQAQSTATAHSVVVRSRSAAGDRQGPRAANAWEIGVSFGCSMKLPIPSLPRWLAGAGALALTIFAGGFLGRQCFYAVPPVLLWPPAGIATAALLLFGYSLWPGIFLGEFFLQLAGASLDPGSPAASSVATAACTGLGASCQALASAWLVQRALSWDALLTVPRSAEHGRAGTALDGMKEVLAFTILAGVVGTIIAPGMRAAAHVISSSNAAILSTLLNNWRADALGVLVFGPLVVVGSHAFLIGPTSVKLQRWKPLALASASGLWRNLRVSASGVRASRVLEAIFLFVGFPVCAILMANKDGTWAAAFVLVTFLSWATVRFAASGTALGMLIISCLTAWNIQRGEALLGLINSSDSVRVVDAQTLLGALAFTFWILAATQRDRRRAMSDLRDKEKRYRSLVEMSPEAVLILENSRISYCNPAGLALLAADSPEALMGKRVQELLIPEERPVVTTRINTILKTGRPVQPRHYHARRLNGEPIDVESCAGPCFGEGSEAIQVILRDITERRRSEEQLRCSLEEKEALLKEVHHRVKNNLQMISSLLKLQANSVADATGLAWLADSQNRVRALALVHETLYRSTNLAKIDMARYLENLCAQLFQAYLPDASKVRLDLAVTNGSLDMDRAIPCGLLVNELVSNALKYAFPGGRSGQLAVKLDAQPDGTYVLDVGDDGVGLPKDLDFRQTKTLGLQLVCGLTRQLAGAISVDRRLGTRFTILFGHGVNGAGGHSA